MRFAKFSEYPRGTVAWILDEAYAPSSELTAYYGPDWRAFDDFIYDNLNFMDDCGFITVVGNKAVGCVSWDPRNLPEEVKVGYNGVAEEYKGQGYGSLQMKEAIERIKAYNPEVITVTTGTMEFFDPAARMYERAGFILSSVKPATEGPIQDLKHYKMEL